MNKPQWGELNRGALAGVMVGALGGMLALRLAEAIHYRDFRLLIVTNIPKLTLISCVLCAVAGWILGGQIGPRLRTKFGSPKAEWAGGVLGGLVLVLALAWLGWHLLQTD